MSFEPPGGSSILSPLSSRQANATSISGNGDDLGRPQLGPALARPPDQIAQPKFLGNASCFLNFLGAACGFQFGQLQHLLHFGTGRAGQHAVG